MYELPVESSSTSEQFSIETLMKEIKPVVTEKYGFQYRDNPKLLGLFGIFGLSKLRLKDK